MEITDRLSNRVENYFLLMEMKMSEIIRENPNIVKQRSTLITDVKLVSDKLYKTSRMVEFKVTGSKGKPYKVVLFFRKKGDVWGEAKTYCSCPYMKWWGPNWNSLVEGFRLWRMGKELPPDIRDPQRKNKVCKHIISAFNKVPE